MFSAAQPLPSAVRRALPKVHIGFEAVPPFVRRGIASKNIKGATVRRSLTALDSG